MRYQRPNNATAVSDDRVLVLGNNVRTEANVLNENLLGTQPLDCAATVLGENCTKNVLDYGAEAVAAYGPFSVQAEYMGAHYNRDAALIEFLRAPGASSLNFSGYYAYATWYLTGESRAASYRTDYRRPGTFDQIKILRPLSAGGTGAWELAVRISELNLNSGGFLVRQPARRAFQHPGRATNRYDHRPQLVPRYRHSLHGKLDQGAPAGSTLQPASL